MWRAFKDLWILGCFEGFSAAVSAGIAVNFTEISKRKLWYFHYFGAVFSQFRPRQAVHFGSPGSPRYFGQQESEFLQQEISLIILKSIENTAEYPAGLKWNTALVDAWNDAWKRDKHSRRVWEFECRNNREWVYIAHIAKGEGRYKSSSFWGWNRKGKGKRGLWETHNQDFWHRRARYIINTKEEPAGFRSVSLTSETRCEPRRGDLPDLAPICINSSLLTPADW